jgi:hypothetical protein
VPIRYRLPFYPRKTSFPDVVIPAKAGMTNKKAVIRDFPHLPFPSETADQVACAFARKIRR